MDVHVNGKVHAAYNEGAVRSGSSNHVMIVDDDNDIQMSSVDQEADITYSEDVEASTFLPSRLPSSIKVQDGSIADRRHGGSRSGLKSFRSISSRNVLSSIPTTDTISVQFEDICFTVNLPGNGKWTLPSLSPLTNPKSRRTEKSSAEQSSAEQGSAEQGKGNADKPLESAAGKTSGRKHSITPFAGTTPARQKRILNRITGGVEPGEMLALLGPSGCGKSTLLNVMAGRVQQECVAGSMRYNGEGFSKSLKRKIGFVTQDDRLFPHLTVYETLVYSALLRLPASMTREEKVQQAEVTIRGLGLTRCRDTIIGGPLVRGVSGGERKRVSIGHELLINPSLLLLDEPTSGLDSTTALRIVQVMQDVALSGRTVVASIHQPSSRQFRAFHQLLLLAEGHPLYFGPMHDALPFFSTLGFSPLFPCNPAEFLLDLATGTVEDVLVPGGMCEGREWEAMQEHEQQMVVKQHLIQACSKHKQAPQPVAVIPSEKEPSLRPRWGEQREWTAPWLLQLWVLTVRGFKVGRHDFLSPMRAYQTIALSLICGLMWLNSPQSTANEIQEKAGFLFITSIMWGFLPMFAAVFIFPTERFIINKERSADMYRLLAYFLSHSVSDLPMEWLLPTVYTIITYFMVALKPTAGAFFATLGTLYLDVAAAQGLGLFVGALLMDAKKGVATAQVIMWTFIITGGYYIANLPVFVKWTQYFSFFYFAYELLLKIQFSPSDTYYCGPPDDIYIATCPMQEAPTFRAIPLSNAWVDALALVAQAFVYRTLAYMTLRWRKIKQV